MAEENKPEGAAGGGEPAAPPPKPPAAPAGPTPQPWDNGMVARLRSRFGQAIREASTYLGQNYLIERYPLSVETGLTEGEVRKSLEAVRDLIERLRNAAR